MAAQSTLTIDGTALRGSALDITSLFNSVTRALKNLDEQGRRDRLIPVTAGDAAAGTRIVKIIRLRLESTIDLEVIDDGTMPGSFFRDATEWSKAFMDSTRPSEDELAEIRKAIAGEEEGEHR